MGTTLAASKALDSEVIAFDNTNPKEANFEAKASGVVLNSTADVHVAFDGVANTGSFLVPADTPIVIDPPCQFTRVSALGSSGSGNLYILARR